MSEGAMSALLIYGKTGTDVKLIEPSPGTSLGAGKQVWWLIKETPGEVNHKAFSQLKLTSSAKTDTLPNHWFKSAERALASYLIATCFPSDPAKVIKTSIRSSREKKFLANSAAASYALYLLAPNNSKAELSSASINLQGTLELRNARYSSRIRPNSEQTVHFKPSGGGEERIFKAERNIGKTTRLKEKGKNFTLGRKFSQESLTLRGKRTSLSRKVRL